MDSSIFPNWASSLLSGLGQVYLSMKACLVNLIYEPEHDKTNKKMDVPIEDSDQPGHPISLISLRCPYEETLGP